DAVGALFFALMFAAFLLQVFSRYVLNAPLGWTLEACLVTYLWFVFWACALMLDEDDHVRFDILLRVAPPPVRRLLAALSALVTLVLFLRALPATADWVAFMAIDRTWTLGIRFDLLFSIYLLFMVAVILRAGTALLRQFGLRPWQR
ncbi:MAG TPA: TRAP transporter small permease subunit, partial [Rhodospirillales bacterium]|nr:TRAP transporter small permease subunit [Rhodospirillales bacterium]